MDALAVAIGSTHAMTSRTAQLDHALLARLDEALRVPLVLHGSSGVPDEALSAAVAGGIAKVNIGTALNIAMTDAIRAYLAAHPEAVDARTYLTVGRQAMAATVTRLIGVLDRTPEPHAPGRRAPAGPGGDSATFRSSGALPMWPDVVDDGPVDRHEHARLDALQRDPYPHYARARHAEGLTFVPELDAWLVARDADVREVLRRPEAFSSANALRPDVLPGPTVLAEMGRGFGGRPVVVSSDGALHQRLRAPIVHGLSPSRVAAVVPVRGRTSLRAGRRLRTARLGRPHGGVRAPTPRRGDRAPDRPGRRRTSRSPCTAATAPSSCSSGPMAEADQLAAARDVVEMQHLLDTYVRERRAHPQDDLCTALITALAPGGESAADELTLDERHEMVAHLQNFLLAGHLTTSALIGSTLLHLMHHRAQWELLCAEARVDPGRRRGGRPLRQPDPGLPPHHDPPGRAVRHRTAHRGRGVRRVRLRQPRPEPP